VMPHVKQVKKNEDLNFGQIVEEGPKILVYAKTRSSTKKDTEMQVEKKGEEGHSGEKEEKKPAKKKVVANKRKVQTDEEQIPAAKTSAKLLHVTLLFQKDNIDMWRNLTLEEGIPLTKVARALVSSLNWDGIHDWSFKIKEIEILCPEDNEKDRKKSTPICCYGDEVKLEKFELKTGDDFTFIYDPTAHDPWVFKVSVQGEMIVNRNDPDMKEMLSQAIYQGGNLNTPSEDMPLADFLKAKEDFDNGRKTSYNDNIDTENIRKRFSSNPYIDIRMDEEDGRLFKW